jgi:glycosyltransferase involved in cell wall biosynthesis
LTGFPKLHQTFVLNEIAKLSSLGHSVSIFALYNPSEGKPRNEICKHSLPEKTHYFRTIKGSRLEKLRKFLFGLYNSRLLTRKQKTELLMFYYKEFRQKGKPPVKILENVMSHFWLVLEIIRVIKCKKIGHIHCHFASKNVELAYLINKLVNVPYTFTTHAYDIFISPNENIKKWAMGAKKVISISEFNRKYMHDNFGIPHKNIKVIACGKCLDELAPASSYKANPFKIVSISRLAEKKGYHYLIKACRILKDKKARFNCEIRGAGPQKAELLELISENNLGEYVKLGDEMKHEEALDFIKSGSVFVLPCIKAGNNDMDGIPTVLMESMAMEIPTISTDVAGIPELIDDSVDGIIVPQKDASALAEAILKIKEDPGFAEKIRKKSREKIAGKFNIDKNIKKLVKVFE